MYASLCTLVLVGIASGSSLWSHSFDPDAVERPIEEYREAYRRHLLEKRQDKKCTDEDWSNCTADPAPGWTLVKGKKGIEDIKCAPIGNHETESVFYVPNNDKPCCKYHGCVVANCKKLQAEFRYDATKKCTKNNTPTGKDDPCKIRIKKKTCGCTVEECEIKGCAKNVTCGECLTLNNKVDECGCQTKKISCTPKPPTPGRETCDKSIKCKDCHHCALTKKIYGLQCAKKYEEHDKSYCEPDPCPPSEECSACQTAVMIKNANGCCKRITCKPLPEPTCVKPKKGKCDSCSELVDKPIAPHTDCKKTIKCCIPKKCVEKAAEDCDSCSVQKVENDECGCRSLVCKLDPALEMCKLKVDYAVTVKTGGRGTPALKFLTPSDQDLIPITPADAKITIIGACTPEQINDPSAENKKCNVVIPGSKLNDRAKRSVTVIAHCENIGIIKKIEVELRGPDVWFVEKVTIKSPKDPENPEEKVATVVEVNKFLGDENPNHKNWEKLKGFKPTTSVETGLAKGKQCGECKKYVKSSHINCTALNEGECETKECPQPDTCDECDLVYTKKDDCNCAKKICTGTYPDRHKCLPHLSTKSVASAPCETKKKLCQNCTCPPETPETCTQCEELAIVTTVIVGENGKPCYCDSKKCKKRNSCMTKEEAQKKLQCKERCQEPYLTGEGLPCGCKKWVCGDVKDECPTNCGECGECVKVFNQECERPMRKCENRCKPKGPCMVADMVNGQQRIDKCDCPIFKNKPCNNDPVHVCEPGKFTVVTGEDACGCSTSIKKPCRQQKPPPCNGTCLELKEESDGCCRKWTCQKKTCPEVEKITCPNCERVVVHDDECKCCKSTCESIPCPPTRRCENGEKPVLTIGPCGCFIVIRCDPVGGEICPQGRKCEVPKTNVELCEPSMCVQP